MRHSTNPWVVLVLICLAQFMVILDATIVNVALPSIQTDLDLSEANLQWIVNAYTLVFGGFLLLGGRAGDLIGLVIFTGASLLDGLSVNSGMLIASRALQGLGAALISPAALSIISTTFAEGKERSRALGVWAAIAIGGSAVGLILGGILTQAFSWPWIFFVNVPVGIVGFVLSLRLIPESAEMLHVSNEQHRELLDAVRDRDGERARRVMETHVRGTGDFLVGLRLGKLAEATH